MERCDLLANISEEPGLIHRPYGSQAMHEANNIVAGWMRIAGMSTRRDQIGNLIGRYEGEGDRTLIFGSYLDTVRDAGKYDGVFGVMVAIACVEQLHDRGARLHYAVEVVGFTDEEGMRFGTTFLGSSAYAGAFDGERLNLEDRNGVTLREAVRSFGGDPDALEHDGRDGQDLLGYCEVHIEQGPVLEELDLPVGVVTAINGQSRVRVGFVGKAGHAGTVPMEGRKGRPVRRGGVRARGRGNREGRAPTVGTVGEIQAPLGWSTSSPSGPSTPLTSATRTTPCGRSCETTCKAGQEIAASRGCADSWEVRQETNAVEVAPNLEALLEEAVQDAGLAVRWSRS
jgi:allantoate deiminase